MSEGGGRRGVLATLFFVSGAAGLVDQVVWLRYLSLVFGNTTIAAATLLAVFMGGLGAGAILFGRRADRLARPFVVYAVQEAGIGLFALASPLLFAGIDAGYVALYRAAGSEPALFVAGRALLAAVALLPPTILMGGTLPVVLGAARVSIRGAGRATALFYGINTLGAVAGAGFAGFFAIRAVGLHATLLVSAGASFAVALAAIAAGAAARPVDAVSQDDASARSRPIEAVALPPGRGLGDARFLLAAAFAMGAASLADEVLWTRVLVFFFGSSVYAFSLLLVLFLAGVAAGSALLVPRVDRLRAPLRALCWIEAALALAALSSIPLFVSLNARIGRLAALVEPRSFGAAVAVEALAASVIVLPPTFLMGLSFPVVVRALVDVRARIGADVGSLYGANTLGAIAGSLGAGFVLIPLLGTQDALLFVGAVNGALAAAFLFRAKGAGERSRLPERVAVAGLPLLLVAAMPFFPANRVILSAGIFQHDRTGDLLAFSEDANATVTIRTQREGERPYRLLELNGVNVAGTSPDLYAVQKMQGHLPLLLAGESARKIVHIGFGSGGTAYAVSLHAVDEIRIVEISPAVLAASNRFFLDINHGVLGDPRVRVEINDGRNFLLATPETFDAVLSDSIHPRYAGNGSLYSRDYFELVAKRLRPGGVVSMWLPMYSLTPENYKSIVAAFREVFPATVVWYESSSPNPNSIVTGRKETGPWDGAAVARAFADPRIGGALADLGFHGPAELLACYLAGGSGLANFLDSIPAHTDDLPSVEYVSGSLFERDWTWAETFAGLVAARPAEAPEEWLAPLPEAERERARRVWRERARTLEDQATTLLARTPPPLERPHS